MDRFFIESPFQEGSRIRLDGPEHHHLRVLRVAVGETIELVNGRGGWARARLESMEKRSASLLLQSTTVSPPDPGPEAAIAVLRMGKLEWVVEKGTELGASAFLFYTADRSEKETVTATQIARLRLIAIAALKQSGRLHLPRFEFHPCLDPLLVSLLPCLFGDLDPEAPPLEPSAPTVRFFTGPEKGFSERELGLLQARARGVRLGQYVLRAETAPIAALARLYRT